MSHTRDDILTEGFFSVGLSIWVFGENKVVLAPKLFRIESVSRNSDCRFQAVHDVTRSKLLRTSGTDASGLRSLVASSVLLGVDGAVGLSASKITGQSGLWKNMELQEFLLIDSRDQTIDFREGGIGRSEHGVGRSSGRHKSRHIGVSVDNIAESSERMSNSRSNIYIIGSATGILGTGTKITVYF